MTDFADALSNLVADEPAANVTRIKDIVAENIRATDPRVVIRRTDHFNHSFVPDFLLQWGMDVDERRVFLRTSFNVAELREDIDVLGSQKPILLSLERVPTEVSLDGADNALANESRGERTLIADPFGFEALSAQGTDRPFVSLFSHAILQGGKGVLDVSTAATAGASIDNGFQAALQADASGTGLAVETSEDLLDPARAGAINRLLHAVWVGSGASGTTFPGASGVTSLLDGEMLRFLLDLPTIEESEFWSRIGRNMTLERLCDAANALDTENLQLLLRACASQLRAKACRVLVSDRPEALSRWSLRGNSLQLDLGRRRVQFVPRSTTQFADTGPIADPPTLQELRDRARDAQAFVEEVKLASQTRHAAYGSADDASIAESEELLGLGGALGDDFFVAAAAVRLSPTSSRTLECNFTTGTALGKTNARFTLADFGAAAIPLLASDLLPSESRRLDGLLLSDNSPPED